MADYEIYAAPLDEGNGGWIWQSRYAPRTIVTVSRNHDDREMTIFCVVRQFDTNFLNRYNEGASKRGGNRLSKAQRYEIDRPQTSLAMNEWYRKTCLGICETTRFRNGRIVSLEIAPATWGLFPATWFPGVRAACHQPDNAIRLGTRLGVLGGWLGVSGLLFALVALGQSFLGNGVALGLLVPVMIVTVGGAILGICICRPPEPAKANSQ